jgi:hypothetical protein
MEGIPALTLWDQVIDVMCPQTTQGTTKRDASLKHWSTKVDYVPTTTKSSTGRAKLLLLEDNDAVIKMCVKGRSPALRHVSRTHRIDLDWLYERLREDPAIQLRYVGTKTQIADILTKGQFTSQQWKVLCDLAQNVPTTLTGTKVPKPAPLNNGAQAPAPETRPKRPSLRKRKAKRKEENLKLNVVALAAEISYGKAMHATVTQWNQTVPCNHSPLGPSSPQVLALSLAASVLPSASMKRDSEALRKRRNASFSQEEDLRAQGSNRDTFQRSSGRGESSVRKVKEVAKATEAARQARALQGANPKGLAQARRSLSPVSARIQESYPPPRPRRRYDTEPHICQT